MQIGNPLIRSYDNNIQSGARTEQMKGAEQTGQTSNRADISGLSEGSVFRGEITDISGEKVTIATDNKGEIMARLQADMELNVGDQLLFSVKENTTSQILIKPMFDSLYSAQTQVLERALDGAGLSATEKNFSAAKELMEAGMPIDKGNMVKLLSQSMKFEGTSMHTLAALNKMNIPVNAENIAQYERYQNYSHQLSGDIASTADTMSEFVSAFPKGTTGEELLAVAKELVEIFTPESNAEATAEQVVADGKASEQVTTNAGDAGYETVSGEIAEGKEAAEGNALINSEAGAEISEKAAANEVNQRNNAGVNNENSLQQGALKNGISGEMIQVTGEALGNSNETVVAKAPTFTEALLDNIAEKTGLTKEEVSKLSDTLKEAGVSGEQIKNVLEQADSSGDALKNMLKELHVSEKNDQAVKNLLSSNEFKKLFSDMVKKEFALNPNEMKDPKEIDELYNKIIKQTESFENTISSKGGDTGSFQQNSQNMQQNMQFMQELNNQMVYAQMPLKLSNQNANSELFVYADKRKLAGKRDDISVMLHLDMDHLGATDVKVTLTGTNVNARFYLNDKESVEIVTDNMGQLAKQLMERGFSLTNEVVMRNPKESPNKVVDEIVDNNAEKSIKRFTFDART